MVKVTKRILSTLVVLSLVIGGGTVLQAMGGSPQGVKSVEQKAKSSKEQKGKLKAQGSNLKVKQVGTPTVQQLLDKVKANYSKIQDLKADMKTKIWYSEFAKWLGIIGDLIEEDDKFLFKAPDKLKCISADPKVSPTIIKNHTHYQKVGDEKKDWIYKLPWYFLLDPYMFSFYFRLDEIITKFDTKVISNPQPNIWVIEAVPKASNPEDMYNYPLPTMKLKIFVDYNKGVITKIGREYSERLIQNFISINNVWVPTKFIKTRYKTDFTVNTKEEITLSDIQINTGIPDSEFEF